MFRMDEEVHAKQVSRKVVRLHADANETEELRKRFTRPLIVKSDRVFEACCDAVVTTPRVHKSALTQEVIADAIAPAITVVHALHEQLYGDGPIQHIDWLYNVKDLHTIMRNMWPQSNVPHLLCQIALWVTDLNASIAQKIYDYLYQMRTSIV